MISATCKTTNLPLTCVNTSTVYIIKMALMNNCIIEVLASHVCLCIRDDSTDTSTSGHVTSYTAAGWLGYKVHGALLGTASSK